MKITKILQQLPIIGQSSQFNLRSFCCIRTQLTSSKGKQTKLLECHQRSLSVQTLTGRTKTHVSSTESLLPMPCQYSNIPQPSRFTSSYGNMDTLGRTCSSLGVIHNQFYIHSKTQPHSTLMGRTFSSNPESHVGKRSKGLSIQTPLVSSTFIPSTLRSNLPFSVRPYTSSTAAVPDNVLYYAGKGAGFKTSKGGSSSGSKEMKIKAKVRGIQKDVSLFTTRRVIRRKKSKGASTPDKVKKIFIF